MSDKPWTPVHIRGVPFDPITEPAVVAYVRDALSSGKGGTIVTPNVDILRHAAHDVTARRLINDSSLVLADGMPLLWASRLAGRSLPARVPGSDLIWTLSAAAAEHGWSVYLLGGEPGVPDRAAAMLRERYEGLAVAGTASPPFGFDATAAGVDAVIDQIRAAKPDLVFAGLGFPRQERLIERLTPELPGTWFVGCGASIAFVAGALRRAPGWMQRSGLEWLHRLASEPRRLFRRYAGDLPFAAGLLGAAAWSRLRGVEARRDV